MRVLVILIVILTLASCAQSNKKVDLYKSVKLEELSEVDSLNLFLGLPTTIKLFDNKLFIVDMFDENKSVKVYDVKKKGVILSFAQKGEGPYEYLHISDVDIYEDNLGEVKVDIYDPVSSKIGSYDYDSLLIMKDNYIPKMITSLNNNVRFHEIHKIKDGYLATGLTLEGKYTFLSDSLKVNGYSGKYRSKPMNGSIPEMSHIIANYGKSVLSENRELLVEIIYNASVLSCYDIKHQEISQRWEYNIHDLDYRMDGKSIVNNVVMGYLSACICDKYIYALYSGEPDNLEAVATYGKEIHVFDLNGHLVNRLSISKPAFALAVDGVSKKIYILSHVPEPSITVYYIG